MLKMLKYEFRRGLLPILIVALVLAAIEVYFVIATALKESEHSAISFSLLILAAFCCYLFVLIYGIVIYNQDLKNKSGYLVFMAPISSYKIIGAKLLAILITGIAFVALIGLFVVIDYNLINARYSSVETFREFIDVLLGTGGYSLTTILLNVLAFVLIFLIQFYMTITLAYLAVSISSTVLQNKNIKGFLSFLLFCVLYSVISVIAIKLPTLGNPDTVTTFRESAYAMLPQIIFYVVIAIAGYLGSAALLDKKISL